MINPSHISEIIKKTLSKYDVKELAVYKLVKGTFLMNSNLTDLYDFSNKYNPKFGMMMIPKNVADYTLFSYMKYKPYLSNAIHDVTGYNVTDRFFETNPAERDTIFDELTTNIQFMILVTYAYFDSKEIDITDDSLENLSKIWKKHADFDEDGDPDNFVELYKETFMK